jgi:ribosomal-protein-alanine N-acetyltransferase
MTRTTEAIRLAPLHRRHAAALADLYQANRSFLAPYQPLADDSFYTAAAQLERIDATRRRARADESYSYGIEHDGTLVGTLTISDIIRGSFQSAHLGYWVSRPMNGRGIATAAVAAAVELAFGDLRLHRLQAATLLSNHASQRVLEKNRFERIGVSPDYLRIAGRWQDHVLFARVSE